MGLKTALNFALTLEGDGNSLSVTLDLTKIPIALFPPSNQQQGNPPQEISSLFDLNGFPPTSVTGVTAINFGGTVSGSISGHSLILSFSTPIANGSLQSISGTFIF